MSLWTDERREKALACCNKWHGTPHHNRIAVCGVGVDCIKLVNEILIDSEIIPRTEFVGYSLDDGMSGQSEKLQRMILACLHADWIADQSDVPYIFGDVLIFTNGSRSAHCGFCTGGDVWHSLGNRSVTISPMALWRHQLQGAIRLTRTGFKRSPAAVISNE